MSTMNVTQVSDGITTPHSREAAIPSSAPPKEQHDSMSTSKDVTTTTLRDGTNTTPVPTAIPDHPETMRAETSSPVSSRIEEMKSLKASTMKNFADKYFKSCGNQGNGDCIPASLSQDKFDNEDHIGDVRNSIADGMIEHIDFMSQFFPDLQDGVVNYTNTVTRVRGKWLDQFDLVGHSLREKRVVAVIDTSGNHDRILWHPQDPEVEDEIWNVVNRNARPTYLLRINETHYMLLRPMYTTSPSEQYFHVKVSEKLYLSDYNSREHQMLIKEGAMLDKKKDRLYVYETQLWNPEFLKFGPGKMTELQTKELLNRTSDRSFELHLDEHMREFERLIRDDDGNKV